MSTAASKPFRLGMSAEYFTPGAGRSERIISDAPAICGTRSGLTKAAASTADMPVRERRSMKANFWLVVNEVASFWRPSRGPTS